MLDQKRLLRILEPDAKLKSGKGKGINGGFDACVMQAVDYVSGGNGETDHPSCASTVITSFCIVLNDADIFSEYRQELLELVPSIVGTKHNLALEVHLAAESAAKSAEYAKYARYAKSAAEYAVESGKYARSAAEYAVEYAVESAAESAAKYAAKSAEYAAESGKREIWDSAIQFVALMIKISQNWQG